MRLRFLLALSLIFVLAACGGDDETNNGADTGTNNGADTSTNNGTDAGTNNGTDTGTNNGTDTGTDTATNNGGTDTGTDTANNGGTDTGDSRLEEHGCTFADAEDHTGETAVTISDVSDWDLGHNACIKVDAGTVVTWEGNFGTHPLKGGVEGTEDSESPITAAGPGADTTPVEVTFDAAGDFPYYCQVHPTGMNGVVYVVE